MNCLTWRAAFRAIGSVALLAGLAPPLIGQATTTATAVPACSDDLAQLRARIEKNYGGYRLEVTGAKRHRFEKTFAALRARAERAEGSDCYVVLKGLISWFDDPHLFLFETPRLDTAETRRRSQAVATLPLDEAQVREYLTSHERDLDPLEGIWYDGPVRFGIVPDPDGVRGKFVAVMLTADSTTWRPGAIRRGRTGTAQSR